MEQNIIYIPIALALLGLVFMLVKMVNRIKEASAEEEEAEQEADLGPSEVDLLTEIRDQLAKG